MSEGGELAEFLRRVFERRSEQKAEKARDRRPSRVIGILGSARQDGNTATLTSAVFQHLGDARVIDLNDLSIEPYSYDNPHEADDFSALAQLMAEADAIVFASPVYWYSMSGPMKIFFDRLTNLTDFYKPLGRTLAGKSAFLIAASNSPAAPACFEPPFAETARYFDMRWGGMLHARVQDRGNLPPDTTNMIKSFAANIQTSIEDEKQSAA
ncbi:MAG: flavodoxin family protein [Pseudomonadota bacterium]